LTVTSEPPGSSGTPLPDLPSVDESLLSAKEGDIAVSPPSYPDVDKPPLSRRGQSGSKGSVKRTNRSVAGRAVGALAAPTPREKNPPKNELDANDRSEIRATRSGRALKRQIKFEEHRERLESKRTKRYLFLYGGIMALSTVSAIGLKYAGLPPGDIARFASLTFISGISGYSLRTLTSKARSAISSRDRSNQDGSSR
jgi:hypothetical protein